MFKFSRQSDNKSLELQKSSDIVARNRQKSAKNWHKNVVKANIVNAVSVVNVVNDDNVVSFLSYKSPFLFYSLSLPTTLSLLFSLTLFCYYSLSLSFSLSLSLSLFLYFFLNTLFKLKQLHFPG